MLGKKLLIILTVVIILASAAYTAGLIFKRYRKLGPISLNPTGIEAVPLLITIKIPRANIETPIIYTAINNGKWEYSEKGVSYLADTPLPGKKGNSVFYGHNWPNILGNLKKAQIGDTIIIVDSQSNEKTFEIAAKFTVTSDQTHILEHTGTPKLTLYTCTGFLDSKRLVVVAVPILN